MAGNSFGDMFRITTCGESHGGAIGVIVDGCPANFPITAGDIQQQLDRRKPGQSAITSPRKESDIIHILSGVFEGKTTGTPILLMAQNQDANPGDYEQLKTLYRPSHADFTYQKKYGIRDCNGSGRASARETLARVAAGAIAQKYLRDALSIEIGSYVEQVGSLAATIDYQQVSSAEIDKNIIRCPDDKIAAQMIALVQRVQQQGDSIGGIIKGFIRNVPIGLGEPVFDKLSADLAKAMLSINAVKGFDIGSGFTGVGLLGSEHNDPLIMQDGAVRFTKNDAGGILGGISNGDDIYFRVAFKPVATISKPQKTVTLIQQETIVEAAGRHDACVLPRAVPIVDAMAALVIMDHYLKHKAGFC